MPKPVSEVVEELNEMLRAAGADVLTIKWPAFYVQNEVEKFKGGRAENIRAEALRDYSIVVGFGDKAIVICKDRDFAPA